MSFVSFGPEKYYSYDPNRTVGRGTYGSVYECIRNDEKKIQQNQQLCVKITTCSKDNDAEKLSQQRERQINLIIQNSQDNQNLVKVHYVYYDQNQSKLYVVMDRCQKNLQNLINEKNKFTQDETLDFIKQFLNGYSVLLKNKVVHRDIKPENILVQEINQSYIYKISDFGIGKIYKENDFKFTKTGTCLYASPECNQAINDQELSKQFSYMKGKRSVVDIFSLGIVVYQLANGSLPQKKSNIDGVKQFFSTIKQNKLTLNIPSFDSQITELISRMLIYNPQQRLYFEELYIYFQMGSLLPEGSEVIQLKTQAKQAGQININFSQNQIKSPTFQTNFQGNQQFFNTPNKGNQNFPNQQAQVKPFFGVQSPKFSNPQINNQQGYNTTSQNFNQFQPQGEQKKFNNFQMPVRQSEPTQQPNFQNAQNFSANKFQTTADRITNFNLQNLNAQNQSKQSPQFFNLQPPNLEPVKVQEKVVYQFQQSGENMGNIQQSQERLTQNFRRIQCIQNIIKYLKRELQVNRKILSKEVINILEIIDLNNWNQYGSQIYSWFEFDQSCEQVYTDAEIFFLYQLASLKNEKIIVDKQERSICLNILKNPNNFQ